LEREACGYGSQIYDRQVRQVNAIVHRLGVFMVPYDYGVANIDSDALLAFHHQHEKMLTNNAVSPGARLGKL
jgi:hypothetical protein